MATQNLTECAEELERVETAHFKSGTLIRGSWQMIEKQFCNYGFRAGPCRETEMVTFTGRTFQGIRLESLGYLNHVS